MSETSGEIGDSWGGEELAVPIPSIEIAGIEVQDYLRAHDIERIATTSQEHKEALREWMSDFTTNCPYLSDEFLMYSDNLIFYQTGQVQTGDGGIFIGKGVVRGDLVGFAVYDYPDPDGKVTNSGLLAIFKSEISAGEIVCDYYVHVPIDGDSVVTPIMPEWMN